MRRMKFLCLLSFTSWGCWCQLGNHHHHSFCLLFQLFQSDLSSFFISPVPVLLFRCWPRQAIKIKAQVRHVIFSSFYFIAAMLWKRLCQTLLSPAYFYCGIVAMWGLQIKCVVDGSRFLCSRSCWIWWIQKRNTS